MTASKKEERTCEDESRYLVHNWKNLTTILNIHYVDFFKFQWDFSPQTLLEELYIKSNVDRFFNVDLLKT